MAIAVTLTPALQTAAALFASLGRGYLAIMGWAFATIAAAQVLAVLGWGWPFPWAVPAVASGAAGPDDVAVPATSTSSSCGQV